MKQTLSEKIFRTFAGKIQPTLPELNSQITGSANGWNWLQVISSLKISVMTKNTLSVLFGLCIMVLTVSSQDAGKQVVSGIVKEKSTGEALPYATVYIEGTSNGTITNVDGYFTLFDIPKGSFTLSAQFLGYKKASRKITTAKTDELIIIELEEETKYLDEVVITGKQSMMKVSENISQVTVSPKQLTSLPSLGEKDIFRSMQLLPGISGSNEASSGLYVRGGTPDQNLVLFDGFTVYHVDHFYGFFSAFNANAIKDVQLYKGGFEPKFGGRTSSVVEITGKTGNEQDFNVGAEVSSISANAFAEIPLNGKGSILIAGRRSFSEIIKSGLYNEIFDMAGNDEPARNDGRASRFQRQETEPVFKFYDLNLKGTFKPSDKNVISLSMYSGKDDLDNTIDFSGSSRFSSGSSAISFNTTDLTAWGNWGTSAKWGRKWGNRLFSNTVVSFSNFFSDRDRSTVITRENSEEKPTAIGFIQVNDVLDVSLRQDIEYEINASHNLGAGFHITYNDIFFDNTLNDSSLLNIENQGITYSGYVQDKWSVTDKFNVVLGARLNYFDVTEKFYPEPRIQASYQITSSLKVKTAWGMYHQFINRSIQEDVQQGSHEIWLLSDNDIIPVQSASHYILGLQYEIDNWLIDIEGYYKELEGLSELNPRIGGARMTGSSLQEIYENSFFEGSGTIRGLDFLLQRKFGNYTGWMAYTISEVEQRFDEISTQPFPAVHDQTHEIKLVNSYDWNRWTFAATWVYATGKPYTAPVRGYSLTMLSGAENFYVTVGDKNGQRLPDYHRLDVSATYNFKFGNAPASLGLSVFNLYDRSNVWYKDYTIDAENEIYSETDVTFIGFTPSLFFTVKLK